MACLRGITPALAGERGESGASVANALGFTCSSRVVTRGRASEETFITGRGAFEDYNLK